MAPSQRIIFTALPAGPGSGPAGGQRLRLSVYVSPRLTDDTDPGTLDHFPDWVQWPSQGLAFSLSLADLNGNPVAGGPCIDVTTPAADQTRWDQVFAPPATVRVDAYQFAPPTGMLFHSYPAAAIHDFLRNAYTELARTAGREYPSADSLIGSPTGAPGLLTDIAFRREPNQGGLGPDEQATIDGIRQALTTSQGRDQANANGALAAGTGLSPAQAFAQLMLFHRRPQKVGPPAGIPAPTLDFHSVVSSLGDHPYLLRLCGLAFDLEFDFPFAALGQLALPGRISVSVDGSPFAPGFETHPVYPETYFDVDFRPYGGDASGGEVDLGSGDYSLIELDQDGGGLKLVEFASGLARAMGPGVATSDTPDAYTVPSIRTGGLSLARTGRAAKLVASLGAAKVANDTAEGASGAPPGPFTADDVTRGFRIDAYDATRGIWRQLCARSGTYRFLKAPGPTQDVAVPAGDEGWVALGMTADPDSPSDGYIGETLLLWNGWSLVTTRPGKGLGKLPTDPTSPNPAPPGADFPLDVLYAATPETLPPQRFGRVYAFRARAVDLAGNSLPFDEAHPLPATLPTAFFGRLEPVISPAVLLHDPKTEGESLERIVIRSNYDIADNTVAPSSRHITPPIAPVDLVERTGLLDGVSGLPDPSKYSMIALRDGAKVPGGTTVAGENYDQPWYPVAKATIPYMPDPLSRGATFVGLPGGDAAVAWDRDGDVWPVTSAFQLVAVAGPAGTVPVLPGVNPRLVVTVPKAVQARVRFSSYLDPSDLEHFTLWNWLESLGLPAAEQNALRDLVAAGGHWMFTPWRELLLVHAVRQPLVAPDITALVAPKQLVGDTYAPFEGHVVIDLASTGKLELKADWDEWIDAGAAPNVPTPMRDTPVTLLLGTDDPMGDDVRLGPLASGPSGAVSAKHEFHDTRHRNIFYEAVATTRFSEFFVERKTVTMTGTGPHLVDSDGVVGGLEQVRSPTETVTYARGADYVLNESAGTIARVATGAIPAGQAVHVAYVAPPITRDSLETPPPTPRGFAVNVLSSARPSPPDVREIVPLFQWTTTTSGGGVHTRRRTAGFRVYLGRPWWSSGEGELLGVLMSPNHTRPGDAIMPYVTVTAQDPAWNAPAVPFGPELADFTLRAASDPVVPLADTPGVVSVAGHRVSWDAGRELWFCDVDFADLSDLRHGYFPFVRMALARWQPDSMPGIELSQAIQAEFVQLAPDRLAAVLKVSGKPKRRRISVSGVSYGQSGNSGEAQITVEIERRRPGVPKGDTGWVSTGAAITLARGVSGGITIWSGTINLPALPSVVDFRLVIREFEVMPADVGVGRRLVYLETVEL